MKRQNDKKRKQKYRSNLNQQKDVGESERRCDCCKKVFHLASILNHIANTKKCNSFYGPKLEELKRSHRMQGKRFYRDEMG